MAVTLTENEVIQRLNAIFPGRVAKELHQLFKDLVTDATAHDTSITNLNTWAAALATKLNADAGVTDVNYDTNPQA